MKINQLKIALKESTKDQLLKQIVDLFKKSEFVKDYYISKYSGDNSLSVLIKYKDIIRNEFFPIDEFSKTSLSVAKKAITEFKKISNDKALIAELMIYYVENGVSYTVCYGDIDEQFYLSMESMYERTLKFIVHHKLVPNFKERCFKIVNDTTGMGWGFHDQLSDIYYGYIGEEQA